MAAAALVLLPFAAFAAQDPLAMAMQSCSRLETYQVTLNSRHGRASETIRYLYKKPGSIRMEFERPHKGAVLVYSPWLGRIKVWPFGQTSPFALTFAPDNPLVQSAQGHRVDQSDIGALLGRARTLQERGVTEVLGEEMVGNRQTVAVSITGESGFAPGGTHRYLLRLDPATWLPLKVTAFDLAGEVSEEVLMEDLATDVQLDDALFSFERPAS